MAFTRFNYDECRTRKRLQQSTDVGNYYLNVPGNGIAPFYVEDPNIRIQKWGGNSYTNMIDIDSHLRCIDKQLKCDTLRNKPGIEKVKITQIQYPSTSLLYTEHSRHIIPPWKFKEVENNYSEYLYYNPQVKSTIPFTHNTSSRALEKELYVPIYENQFQRLNLD